MQIEILGVDLVLDFGAQGCGNRMSVLVGKMEGGSGLRSSGRRLPVSSMAAITTLCVPRNAPSPGRNVVNM